MPKFSNHLYHNAVNWIVLLCGGTSFLTLYSPSSLSSGLSIFALILIFYTDYQFIRDLASRNRAPIFLILLTFLMATLLSTIPTKTIKSLYDFLRAFSLFIVFSYLGERFESKTILRTLSILAIATLIYSLINAALSTYPPEAIIDSRKWKYILEVPYSRNIIATQVALISAPVLCILLDQRLYITSAEKVLYTAFIALSGAIILLSQSRGTLLAIAITVASTGFFYGHKSTFKRIMPILIVYLAIMLIFDKEVLDSLASRLNGSQDLLNGRTPIYSATWNFITESPWTGYGPGTFKHLDVVDKFVHPHSLYLELLFSLGFIGSILLTAGLLLLSPNRTTPLPTEDALKRFSSILLLFILARGIFDIHLFVYDTWAIVFTALGAGALKIRPRKVSHTARKFFKHPHTTKNRDKI